MMLQRLKRLFVGGRKKDEQLPPPPADQQGEEFSTCCICLTKPKRKELSVVNGCHHRFCFDCIDEWASQENTCPLCKARFTQITRVVKQHKRRGRKKEDCCNHKHVVERNQQDQTSASSGTLNSEEQEEINETLRQHEELFHEAQQDLREQLEASLRRHEQLMRQFPGVPELNAPARS